MRCFIRPLPPRTLGAPSDYDGNITPSSPFCRCTARHLFAVAARLLTPARLPAYTVLRSRGGARPRFHAAPSEGLDVFASLDGGPPRGGSGLEVRPDHRRGSSAAGGQDCGGIRAPHAAACGALPSPWHEDPRILPIQPRRPVP